jgi:hypothetical protein
MVISLISFASGGFFGGGIGQILSTWEQAGVFSYLIPFLVIFALVFGILSKMKIFEASKAVNAVIALAVGLMALQFDFVPRFFSEIFPRLGIGIAIVLVIIVLTGMFWPEGGGWVNTAMIIIGAIIVVAVLLNTSTALGWSGGASFWQNYLDYIIIGILAAGAIILIILSGGKKKSP